MGNTLDLNKDFHSHHFTSIQALRGILALFIVLEHTAFARCGAFGVDAFFCISGFMIMFSTHNSTKRFFTKRLIRILPLYYIMTIASFLLLLIAPGMFQTTAADPIYLVKSLLFIPFDIGNGALQPLLRPGWTINCEIFFYFIFWLSFKISHKYRGLISSVIIALLVVIAKVLPVALSPDTTFTFTPLTFYGAPVMLDFILGIIAYYVCRGIYTHYQKKSAIGRQTPFGMLMIAPAIIFLLLIVSISQVDSTGFQRPLIWGVAGLLLVLCFFLMGLKSKSIPKSLVTLGNVSFSLYLLHYYPVMLLNRIIPNSDILTPLSLLGAVAGIIISVVLALISHAWIENRLSKWLKRFWK